MKPLIIHGQARAELDAAIGYYQRQKAGLGLDLQAEIQRALDSIRENPLLGAPYKATEFRHHGVRRFPYVIFYAELEEAIWIVAIAHGSRRPDYWKRRRIE